MSRSVAGRARPLRVLMVNTHATRGGAARMATTLARALHVSGDAEVRFFHCGDTHTRPPLYGVRRLGSRQLNAVLARLGGSLAVADMGLARDLAREAESADVIHLHNLHGYYLDWNRLLEAIADRPIVWTWHDVWGATGRCGLPLDCEGWRTGCAPCPHPNLYPAAWLDRAAAEYRKKSEWWARLERLFVAAQQQWLRQIAVDRGFAPERVVCIPNPVDLSTYKPVPTRHARQRLGLKVHARYLLFVAADCDNPLKGYREFLSVVAQSGWHGLVAGGMPSDLPADVRYLGYYRDPGKLSLCYSAADAVVVPSLSDNSPNTVAESMACGTPVFGFAVGGIPSEMHSRWGGVVAPRDAGALTRMLLRQMPNGGKPNGVSAEVRAFAASRWGSEKIAREYLALYHRAIAAPARAASGSP